MFIALLLSLLLLSLLITVTFIIIIITITFEILLILLFGVFYFFNYYCYSTIFVIVSIFGIYIQAGGHTHK